MSTSEGLLERARKALARQRERQEKRLREQRMMLPVRGDLIEQTAAQIAHHPNAAEFQRLLRQHREQPTPEVARKMAEMLGAQPDDFERQRRAYQETEWKRVELQRGVLKLAREWTAPHWKPQTASNFELLAMNAIRFRDGIDVLRERLELEHDWVEVAEAVADSEPQVARVLDTALLFWRAMPSGGELEERLLAFVTGWPECGFARLEISHKYAAALCVTDVPPDVEVRAPWPAWSLVLPPGLLGEDRPLARVWVLETDWVLNCWGNGSIDWVRAGEAVSSSAQLIENLIRGACLSMAEPEKWRKKGSSSSRGKGNERSGPPSLEQARFMLAPPVSIDLREHVREALAEPRAGHAPKIQFLVRGHWRQQAHGAARALRKTIWIQPFWKGPEEARVLLRSHKLKEGDSNVGELAEKGLPKLQESAPGKTPGEPPGRKG